MRKLIYGLVILLAILHQDFWWWDNKALVFGFMPLGLFYHTVFSCLAALVWFGATKLAWPSEIEAWAEAPDDAPPPAPTIVPGSGSAQPQGGDQ